MRQVGPRCRQKILAFPNLDPVEKKDKHHNGNIMKKSGARADFWFGLGLVIFGFALGFESWRMPRLAELNVHPMTAPGLVPGLLGAIIFFLGSILFIRAARAGGWRLTGAGGDGGGLSSQTKRFFVALGLCLVYAGGLVGLIPFWAATFLFVMVFIVIFEWRRDRVLALHLRAIALAALQAVIVSAAVTFIFEKIFLVRLP